MDIIQIEDFSITYADGSESLRGINLGIKEHAINVLFGPAGGGKSTLLRAINRLNDLTDVKEVKGSILFKRRISSTLNWMSPGCGVGSGSYSRAPCRCQ